MFTIPRNYIHPQRKRGNKKAPSTIVDHKGDRLTIAPFKPSYIDVSHFAQHRFTGKIIKENPWLVNVRMFENPYLIDQLAKADYSRLTIELSTELLEQDVNIQRDIFIRLMCSFIAQRVFNDMSEGQPYQLLVKRYSAKEENKQQTKQGIK